MVETVAGPHFSAERGRLTRDRVYSSAIVCPAFLNTRWYGMDGVFLVWNMYVPYLNHNTVRTFF